MARTIFWRWQHNGNDGNVDGDGGDGDDDDDDDETLKLTKTIAMPLPYLDFLLSENGFVPAGVGELAMWLFYRGDCDDNDEYDYPGSVSLNSS